MPEKIAVGQEYGTDDFRAILIHLREQTAKGYIGGKAVEAIVVNADGNRFRITKALGSADEILHEKQHNHQLGTD